MQSAAVQENAVEPDKATGDQESAMRVTGERAPLKVALLGCGVVGSQVYRLITEQAADLKARAGARLDIVGVAVRDPGRPRDVPVSAELLTTEWRGSWPGPTWTS